MTASVSPASVTPEAPKTSPAPKDLCIRDATDDDMAAIQRIYAHYVLHNSATFETDPPSVEEMRSRREKVLGQGFPYLVATLGNEVVGYAYASSYRPRPAYRFTIEDSIYLASDAGGRGAGTALLTELIRRCEQGPARQMIAVIAGTQNAASINLHRKLGFRHVGTQPATGFKFNQWIDVVFMQRALGEGDTSPPTD